MPTSLSFMETLTAIAYRLATYLVNNILDDPAMLAIGRVLNFV